MQRGGFEGFLARSVLPWGVLGEGMPLQLWDEALEGPLPSAAHPLALPPQWGPGEGGTLGQPSLQTSPLCICLSSRLPRGCAWMSAELPCAGIWLPPHRHRGQLLLDHGTHGGLAVGQELPGETWLLNPIIFAD